MNNKKRKNQQSAASQIALESLEDVIGAMNDEKTPEIARVESIVTLLGMLTEGPATNEKAGALAALRVRLGAYRWVSYVTPSTEGFVVLNAIADRARLGKAALWEHEAVRDLLTALPRLGLGKKLLLRRCEACERWFLAKRSDARTCSSACRQWLYDSSPQHREYKKAKMKNIRKDAKTLEQLRKVRVGFRDSKRHVVSRKKSL